MPGNDKIDADNCGQELSKNEVCIPAIDLVLRCMLDAVVRHGNVDVVKGAVRCRRTLSSTPRSSKVAPQMPLSAPWCTTCYTPVMQPHQISYRERCKQVSLCRWRSGQLPQLPVEILLHGGARFPRQFTARVQRFCRRISDFCFPLGMGQSGCWTVRDSLCGSCPCARWATCSLTKGRCFHSVSSMGADAVVEKLVIRWEDRRC